VHGRLALGLLVSAAVTAVVLGVPVLSGSSESTPPVSLDASPSSSASSTSVPDSPVVMGRAGAPLASTGVPVDTSSAIPEPAGSPSPDSSATSTAGTPSGPRAPVAAPSPSLAPAPGTTAPSSSTVQTPTVPESAAAVPAELDGAERVLALVNAARTEEGCAALIPDAGLAGLARAHSDGMRDSGLLSLGSLLESGGRAATLAHGADDPGVVVGGWLDDPADRAVLLDCGFTSVGLGIAPAADGSWWTQLLS